MAYRDNPYDPRFLRKITEVNSRVIKANVLTAASDWGVGGFQRNQPRFLEDDEKRPPAPRRYWAHTHKEGQQTNRVPTRLGARPIPGNGRE